MLRLFSLYTALAVAIAACTPITPRSSLVDMSGMPADLPRSAVADLDLDVQRQINRGFALIDRRLRPVCTPQQIAQAKEALVLFGWATTSTIANPPMQAYAARRAPELRAARETVGEACANELDELVQVIRDTQP